MVANSYLTARQKYYLHKEAMGVKHLSQCLRLSEINIGLFSLPHLLLSYNWGDTVVGGTELFIRTGPLVTGTLISYLVLLLLVPAGLCLTTCGLGPSLWSTMTWRGPEFFERLLEAGNVMSPKSSVHCTTGQWIQDTRGWVKKETIRGAGWPSRWQAKVKWKSFCHLQLFATPGTVACQTPLPMEFSRQEYWSG